MSSYQNQHFSPKSEENSFSSYNAQLVNRSLNAAIATNHVHDPNNNRNGEEAEVPNSSRNFFEEIRNGKGHWSFLLRQVILAHPSSHHEDSKGADEKGEENPNPPHFHLQTLGGSENGQFAIIGNLSPEFDAWIAVGYLQTGDIILDVQGQQVAGYTQADVMSLLLHCLRGGSVTLTVAPRGSLGPELRSYLNTRFQKGSVDHALQGVVRDNLYLRTVPVTTRTPRSGEIPGVDYTFLSVEEFMELEQNGSLLESGVYAGNHYGTPKPWANGLRNTLNTSDQGEGEAGGSEGNAKGLLPGMHPSSEGKRKRNRSNVEALGAGDDEATSSNLNSSFPSNNYNSRVEVPTTELGPLPNNWEMSYTEKGEVYFIDHNTGTSHWLDPRLSRIQKLSLEDCAENELPFGWEKIEDPHYGTYYIDHVNRRTQFENPVLQAKQSSKTDSNDESPDSSKNKVPGSSMGPKGPGPQDRLSIPRGRTPVEANQMHNDDQRGHLTTHSSTSGGLSVKGNDRSLMRFFTRDPTQLVGERIGTTLVKSSRGLGFTIVGGDDDDGLDEFLQIKSVVADGPAWRDAKLRTGDVLVRVNGRCVLGYTHQEMVSIFQSIAPGEEVHLEVCRGYPLPFDPADPNTEIVTTVAVAPFGANETDKKHWNGRSTTPDSLAHSAHSLPELSNERVVYGKSNTGRPASVDLLLDSPRNEKGKPQLVGIFHTVTIVKGNTGFGFTIADSVAGQKVKKVLDATHCGGLEEGDRLIAIDGNDLRGLSHTEVVQILKDFPLGRDASLTIQRLQAVPQNNMKQTGFSPAMLGRSKTPNAELGHSRIRMRDSLPERAKTPLIDSGILNGQGGIHNGEFLHALQDPNQYSQEKYSNNSIGLMSNNDPNLLANDLNLNQNQVIRDWLEMTIDLQRQLEGFGFRIVGGTEEGSQVSVGHIVPNGAAAVDGRLRTNDQLVAVDGVSVIGASHQAVVQLMSRSHAHGRVVLSIRRPIYGVASPKRSPSAPIHVTLMRQPTEGFGFVIISNASKPGTTIGKIVEGSPADRSGELHVGDRILAVNQVEILQLHHSQIVQLIKESSLVLTLTILPSGMMGSGSNTLSHQKLPLVHSSNMLSGDWDPNLLKDIQYDIGTAFISPESHPIHFDSNHIRDPYPEGMEQVFSVNLSRGARGFGFSIRGGKEFQNMPLFVLRLADEGPSSIDGRMKVGDQILMINGISTQGMTHSQAINLIKNGGSNVNLLLRRGSVPFPFLSQVANFYGGRSGSENNNGLEEEQSLSSNNDPQFISQSSPMYREHPSNYNS